MTPTRQYKILIVEDEGLIAHDIANRVEAMGHEVINTVSTAKEAIAEAPNADLILMDIRLDGPGDGIQAADIIRQHHAKPVVFLTAHADRFTLERARQAVPYGYIVKPVQPATLGATLDIAIYRHEMERAMAEQRALLDSVLASVADAILVAGANGLVRSLNTAAEAMTGWTSADALGKPMLEVLRLTRGAVDAENRGETSAEDPVPLTLLRGEPIEFSSDTILVRRDGTRIRVEGSAAPVRAGETLAGVAVSLRDIGAREWHAKQLELAAKVESATRLAGCITDQYTSLFAGIRIRAVQLLERFPEYTSVRKPLEEIEQFALAGERVNRRLAALSAQSLPRPELFSMTGLVRRTRKMIESIAGESVKVILRAEGPVDKLWADAAQMEQVLLNLVIHASKRLSESAAEDRILTLDIANQELRQANGAKPFVRLSVAYSCPEPNAAALFEPSLFAEEDRSAMFTAHNIVTEHGGYFSATQLADSFCFEVLLPSYAPARAETQASPENGVPAVLLVEPAAALRRELQNFFEANGYRLLEAADAEEALTLAQIHEGPLDLAIAAHTEAPVLNGFLRELRPELKLLEILSEGEQPEARSDASIARPFTEATLLDRVRGLLSPTPLAQTASVG
ncbi:MAG: response regulator [Bryobacteraceae bacterium]